VAETSAPAGDEISQAVDQMNLLFQGTPTVRPEGREETEFAEEFATWIQNCRTLFADPSFDLPTLPASAIRVMSLMQNPDASTKEISRTLQLDIVMTAKFLKMANSAYYGGKTRVESVHVAVDRLGMDTVKGVVLAISLNSTVIKEKRLGDAAKDLWSHSISTGLAVQELTSRLKLNQTTAFTLGLMHDIGKIPTVILLNKLRAKRPGVRPELIETLLEDAHTQVGTILAEVWNMPYEVRLIAGGHHCVHNMAETEAYIMTNRPETPESEIKSLTKLLSCVILADRSLGALGMAREPGDLTIGGSSFATDLGLSVPETMDYLMKLPNVIKTSDLMEM